MSVAFTPELVRKYQTYMVNKTGISIPDEIAQHDLTALAELFTAASDIRTINQLPDT